MEELKTRIMRLCCTTDIDTGASLQKFSMSASAAQSDHNIRLVDATLNALAHYMFNLNSEEICDEFFCKFTAHLNDDGTS